MIPASIERMSARDRRALLVGLAILVPGFVWIVGVRPYQGAVAEMEEQIFSERDLLQRERALLESKEELRHALARAEKEAGSAGRRLARAPNEVLAEAEVTDALEVIAIECRVLLTEIRSVALVGSDDPPAGVNTFQLAVEAESDMAGVLDFIRKVESSPLLLRIAGLTLDPVTTQPNAGRGGERPPPRPTGVVEFSLVVEAYSRSAVKAPSTTSEEGA